MTVAERSSKRSRESGGRGRALLVLCVTAMLVIPAAISWACGPNRAIQLDKVNYTPGQTVTVSGANLEPGAKVNIRVDGAVVTTATASATSTLSASFPAPGSPGTYTVNTDGVDENGQALAGTGNSVPLVVVPASSGGGSGSPGANSGSGTSSPAPGTTSGGGDRGRGDRGRSVSGGERVRNAPSSSGSGSGAGAVVNTTEGTIDAGGTTAFAGSVSRAARVDAAEGAAARRAETGARPSERSAGADLWSGLTSSNNPSLAAGEPAGSDSGTGAGLALALGLLGAGVLGLIGLGAAEAQRRRRATSR